MTSWLTKIQEASGHEKTFSEENPDDAWFFHYKGLLGVRMEELVKHLSPQTSLGTDSFGDSV